MPSGWINIYPEAWCANIAFCGGMVFASKKDCRENATDTPAIQVKVKWDWPVKPAITRKTKGKPDGNTLTRYGRKITC